MEPLKCRSRRQDASSLTYRSHAQQVGGEAKPLPYLLAQVNLLLHGLESPQIDPGNSLRFPLREVGDKDRVDIIHTIVRLPNGVFAPYTSIPTNLLFFDRSGPTKDIWYYEQPLPERRKQYTKTQPLQYEESAPCLAWWKSREENERAWKVSAADVLKYDDHSQLISANLDMKNPNSKQDLEHLPPEALVDEILAKERRILEIMEEIRGMLGKK